MPKGDDKVKRLIAVAAVLSALAVTMFLPSLLKTASRMMPSCFTIRTAAPVMASSARAAEYRWAVLQMPQTRGVMTIPSAGADAFRLLEKLGTEPKVWFRSRKPWVQAAAAKRREEFHV